MSRILVLGSGLTGLTTALLLARDGHDVTVLERDPAPPPDGADAAWAGWARPGVAQFRQLHFLLPRWRAVMAAEVPEVLTAMLAAGACRTNSLHQRRAEVTGGWRPGDERFDAVTARRPVIEAAVASVAAGTPGVTVRRGVRVAGLVTAGRSAVPQVVGVRTEDGDLSADLVVDATGRNGRTTAWITEAGGLAPAETTADSGFRYYARHYRARAGRLPEGRDVALTHYASVSLLTLAADNATFGLGIVTSANDRALRPLQRVERWEVAMRSYPAVAHWLDAEPITDVTVFGGLADRRRSFVVDGRPVVTGLVAVGDAWACTNPSLGRGVSIGALHACVLRDAVAKEGLGDADALARRFHEETERVVGPYVDATLAFDRHRLATIEADVTGVAYEPDDPSWTMAMALHAGARHDPELARAHAAIGALLATPSEVFADPAVRQRALPWVGRPWLTPGPTRAELLDVLDAT
jgi:2-polyprenyl-6-methoxyphenol hydroxylase-like FAD-dependent oxidoreductase